jgi:putative transcriptional regulator
VTDFCKGRLLVATPALGDPNFDRTVVLVLEHTAEGAVGVVLNRPSATDLVEAGADWGGWDLLAAAPTVVFVGGPVSRNAVICLGHASTAEVDGYQSLLPPLGLLDLAGPPPVGGEVEAIRLFAGYAGWGEGQLESEIAEGAWFVVDAQPGDALTDDPGQLWAGVLRRQRGRLALFAACPPDPTVN